jgi:hypothetical protein
VTVLPIPLARRAAATLCAAVPVIVKHDHRYKDGRPHEAVETEALRQTVLIEILRDRLDELLPVADEVQLMCEYVNDNWSTKSAVHLAAYVLWKMNWIHPFADGNGRTARAISYVVLSIKLDSLLPGTPTIPEQLPLTSSPTTGHWKRPTANGPTRRSMCPNWKWLSMRCCLNNSSMPLNKHPAKRG